MSTKLPYSAIFQVLELSEKYQKGFGPLRYFVAGFLKFLCLPKYHFELEYLPTMKDAANSEGKLSSHDIGTSPDHHGNRIAVFYYPRKDIDIL
ncbi:hypothetical protein COCNU_scaffold000788G000010 [Cocos nucifera]|nr:hypothetical protein [Cocos nucifera]